MDNSNGEDVNGEMDPFLYHRKIKAKDNKVALCKMKNRKAVSPDSITIDV